MGDNISKTGGDLNKLNGKYGISAPKNSVPIQKLIENHNPESPEELVDLIKYHYEYDCKCGLKSKGTIEDFGRNLYEAQRKEWGEYRFSLERCIEFQYYLFVIQSLGGHQMEKKAKEKLEKEIKQINVESTNQFYDEELRIDFIIKKDEDIIAGVQVKPESFKNIRMNVKKMHKNKNSKVDHPVYYLYYRDDEFTNLEEIIHELKESS